MHGHVAAVSVAVHQRVFGPAPLVGTHAAPADHLLHVIRRTLAVRRQTTLAGDHPRRKRTCGGIRPEERKASPKTLLVVPPRSFRSRPAGMPWFKPVYVPFWSRIFITKTSTSRRDGAEKRGDFVENRKHVMTQGACVRARWQHVGDGCDWTTNVCDVNTVPRWR